MCYMLCEVSKQIPNPDLASKWMTSHKVTVGIFSLQTKQVVYLDLGDPTDRYFTNIAWAPDGKTLYLYELNRDQNHTTLDAYDATTGRKLKTLREESSDKYVEPLHPITFLPWDLWYRESRRDECPIGASA